MTEIPAPVAVAPGAETRSAGGWSCLVAVGVLASACGSSLIGSASTTPVPPVRQGHDASTTTTAPLAGEVAVAFPVVACTTSTGGSLGTRGWRPTVLLAPIPTALVGKVEFYSDGVHTVLGPTGWTCAQTDGNQGASGLVVSPPGHANPPAAAIPPAGTEGIFAIFDTTGNAQGISLVCPVLHHSVVAAERGPLLGHQAPRRADLDAHPRRGRHHRPGRGGRNARRIRGDHAVTGAVIFPQSMPAVTDGSSVDIAVESCSLTDTSLCPTILSDFEVREFPVPAPGTGISDGRVPTEGRRSRPIGRDRSHSAAAAAHALRVRSRR